MLTIRNEQLQLFEHEQETRFIDMLVELVRSEYGHLLVTGDKAALVEFVTARKAVACSYGLVARRDIVAFVRLACVLGSRFDRARVFHDVLTDRFLTGRQKMNRILIITGRLVVPRSRDDND